MQKQKIFYGWFIAIVCFVIAVVAVGFGNGCSSLYVKPICDDFGIGRGTYSVTFIISSLVAIFANLSYGIVYRTVKNIKCMFIIGLIFMLGAFAVFQLAPNIFVLYCGYLCLGMGGVYMTVTSFSVVISSWFIKKRGAVLGFVYAGTGIGGAIANPLVGGWIAAYGWRTSYSFTLIIIMVVCIPALFFIKNEPSDIGLSPLGGDIINVSACSISTDAKPLMQSTFKSPIFYLVLIMAFLLGATVLPMYYNASAHMAQMGLDVRHIALIMSALFALNSINKIVMGIVNDRFGIKLVFIIPISCLALSSLILIFAKGTFLAISFAVIFSVAYVSSGIPIPLLVGKLFSQSDLGSLLCIVQAAFSAGTAIGSPLYGLTYDAFGSYNYAFSASLLLCGIILLLLYKVIHLANLSEPVKV